MDMSMGVVLPGDKIDVSLSMSAGPGVYVCEEEDAVAPVARASVAGMLRGSVSTTGEYSKVWVDYSSKRYVPAHNERVLGIVTKTSGRQYRVDIGTAISAVLPELAFDGATKRNKPNIQVGEIVYARMSQTHRHSEPELSCIDQSGKANGLGPLAVSGYLLKCPIGLCRKLLSPTCTVLEALGQYYKYESTVGMNGLVWINCTSIAHTIVIVNAIKNSQYMTDKQCKEMVKRMAEQV